ncbi:prolyl hydroxylase family protein [Terricaulis sp.]|uniref:prolyl hydroxylase family protein n=1 Tax=Terricaulis sp. TaxID=2768686 RepID=UPI003783FC64
MKAAITAAYAQRWDEALDLAQWAAEAGDADAGAQLGVLAGMPGLTEWALLRASIDVQQLVTPRSLDRLSNRALIGVSRGYATPSMCAWLIQRAKDRLEPSLVNDAATGELRVHPMRTALNCAFDPDHRDLIVAVLQARAAKLANMDVRQHEVPNVISYEPGQQFGLHVDYIDPATPGFERELQILGQRTITIVTYLNDDFDGAPTHFPALNIDFRGKTGDAIAWSNVLPNGQADRNTVHAGMPPTRGRKWVLSQWLRDRAQPFA